VNREKIIFNLKRFWEIDDKTVDLYEAIKSGDKTSEWRDLANEEGDINPVIKRLLEKSVLGGLVFYKGRLFDLTNQLKTNRAWFVVGYPKGSLPRLEADITKVFYHGEHGDTGQVEIQFENVVEITENAIC